MEFGINREAALALLKEHNKDPFHIRHALTVEGTMRWFAQENGEDPEFWGLVGLLHDIDFEEYPEEHCIKAPDILRPAGVKEEAVRAICSHGWGITVDIKPEHPMEKTLYAVDELTGLIGAAALMRPSKSVQDMEVKSLRKKFKSTGFAAGCSREVIQAGADLMGIELTALMEQTILAMRSCEAEIESAMAQLV